MSLPMGVYSAYIIIIIIIILYEAANTKAAVTCTAVTVDSSPLKFDTYIHYSGHKHCHLENCGPGNNPVSQV